ncbi:hypothetical protein AALL81_05510 [Phocaeicola sartorii]
MRKIWKGLQNSRLKYFFGLALRPAVTGRSNPLQEKSEITARIPLATKMMKHSAANDIYRLFF